MGDNEIINNFVFLTENLSNLHGILIRLIQDGTISAGEKQEIENENSAPKSNDKLLTLIQRKWSQVRGRFLEILRETNNEHCAEKIETTAANKFAARESQVRGIKRTKTGNDNNPSTNQRSKKSKVQNAPKIGRWWPEKKQLIKSLHKRKHGDHLLIEELDDRIQKDENRTVAICESAEATKYSGMGGMGKTLTAKWYAHHYEEHYDHILWIDCGEGSLIKSFETLARDLEVKNRKEILEVKEFARKCYESLFGFRCLWIYDNAESYQGEDGIFKVLPKAKENFFCLITSRSREWGVKNGLPISELQLEIFSAEESLTFLRSNLNEENTRVEHQLKELCRLLGNLPLALQLAVAAFNNSRMDVKTYIEKNKFVKVLDAKFDDYERTINGNVKVSLDLIEKEKFGRTANEILMIFGYIRPDHIQLQFFKSALQIEDDRKLKESVKLLRKYSLVAKTKGINKENEKEIFFSIHRLLQQIIRHNGKEKEKEIVRKILGCEGFIDYKLLPFTKYADEHLKKEFPKVKAELLDQKQLKKLMYGERFEECVQLSKFIHQELQKPATKLNYAICLHENGQVEECVKTAEDLLAKIPLTVKDDQLSISLERILLHLKRVNLRVDIKSNYYLMDLRKENNYQLREQVGDLLLFSYLRLNKIDKAIAIVKQTASQVGILSILRAVTAQKKFKDSVQLSKLIDEELKTKTTKLNYAICLQKNGQWEESVATLNELHQQEMEEEIKYKDEDVEMGLLRLDVEVSRELVGGHLLLAVGKMDNKQKIEDLLKKRKQFTFNESVENLGLLIRLVHSHLIRYNYSLLKDYYLSFITLNLDVETKKIELWGCSLSLDSFDRLSPEELTLWNVSFFRDGQELKEVKVNDFLHFTNIKRLTLSCHQKKNLSVDLSGDVSIDYLDLENVEVLNWSSCKWNVKELKLENNPFVEKTHIQLQQMEIWSSSLDVSCLPPTIQKLNLSLMSEVFVSGGVDLPNLKHLTLLEVSDVGCLCHFHSAPLTHIHLEGIEGEVNVDLLPPTLTHLRITKTTSLLKLLFGGIRVVGGVRRVDNLTLERFSFEGVEGCLSHLHTHNLLIHSHNNRIEVKYLVELMKKEIKTITVGRIEWDKEDFQNYSSQLDRRAYFYLLEGGRGRGMDEEDFNIKRISLVRW